MSMSDSAAQVATPVPAATAARMQPVDRRRLDLAGDFAGWWADVDLDLELRTIEDLGSGETPRVVEAIGRMVLDWNFVDKEGKPMPAGPDGARRIGKTLLSAFMDAFGQAAANTA